MQNIVYLFIRYSSLLFFVALEILCFIIIGKNNTFHKVAFINKANAFTGSYYERVSNAEEYVNLKEVNDSLAAMNALLLTKLETKVKEEKKLYSNNDSIFNNLENKNTLYTFFKAKVISNSTQKPRNYIYIDRGTQDGVEKDMGVMSDNGPVGVVVNATNHYACVMSFLHKDANVSVKVLKNGYLGTLKWEGYSTRVASLEEIPKHVKLKLGDTIVTSGYSSYYPEGIQVGRVIKYEDAPESNFAEVKVLLDNDFGRLNYVYVINNMYKKELSTLIEKTEEKPVK